MLERQAAAARSIAEIDLMDVYRALAEGRITEDAAQAAEEAVHARKTSPARGGGPRQRRSRS